MARLGKEQINRLVPMHRIAVAKQVDVVVLMQLLHQLQPTDRDIRKQFTPCLTDFLVCSRTFWSTMTYLITELFLSNLTQLKVEEHVYLLTLVHIMGYLASPYALKSLNTLVSVKIDKYTAKVENYVLYTF